MWNVDDEYVALVRTNRTEERLLQWRAAYRERNELIRYATGSAGLSRYRTAKLMGVSRQTVDRILDGDPRALRQAPR